MSVAIAERGSPKSAVQLGFNLAFGPFRLERDNRRLLRAGNPVRLRPKTFALLDHLAARPGYLVTKDQLLAAVWAETTVTDTVLKVTVRELRVALGDTVKSPRYIETAHRMGYRFIGDVVQTKDAAPGRDVLAVLDTCEQLIATTIDLLQALRYESR